LLAMYDTACLSPACVAGNPESKAILFVSTVIVKHFLRDRTFCLTQAWIIQGLG